MIPIPISINELVFNKSSLMKQFELFKDRLFYLQESGLIDAAFEQNKKKMKSYYNINITKHNIIERLMQNTRLRADLGEFLTMWTHIEAMGAAEGKVEGDVSMGHNILSGRYRLSFAVFGLEFTLRQLQVIFKYVKKEIAKAAAKLYVKRWGAPFRTTVGYKSKYPNGKVLWTRTHEPELETLNDNAVLLSNKLPSMNDVSEDENDNDNVNEDKEATVSEHESDDDVIMDMEREYFLGL